MYQAKSQGKDKIVFSIGDFSPFDAFLLTAGVLHFLIVAIFSHYLEFVAICCIMEGGKKHSVFYLSRLFAGRMTDVRVQGGLHEDYWFFT